MYVDYYHNDSLTTKAILNRNDFNLNTYQNLFRHKCWWMSTIK